MTENYSRFPSPTSTEFHSASETSPECLSSVEPIYSNGNLDSRKTIESHSSKATATGGFASSTSTELSPSSESSIFSPSKSALNGSSASGLMTETTVSQAVVKMLGELGVQYAFGVSGGGIGPLWAMLEQSEIQVMHFRHETGAAFAAIESYFASERPTIVFVTTGPGITNALTGLLAAKGDGAKVILLSAATSTANRGRWACQETSAYTMPFSGIFTSGVLFDYATVVESSDCLPEIACRLALGLAKPGGFVAHISIPTPIQSSPLKVSLPRAKSSYSLPTASEEIISECVRLLSEGSFAIWVGFGARGAAAEIRELAERTGAAVMCSPRGKGIFPEDHPQFVGVTGFSGHESVLQYMQQQRPLHTLVLGTRLGEPTSFWLPAMLPERKLLHVDIDPEAPSVAYPYAETFAIQSEVRAFVQALLKYFSPSDCLTTPSLPRLSHDEIAPGEGLIRPEMLMQAIQQVMVEGSDVLVMAEAGNSFAWATHLLRFTQPNRYRISTGVGAMGHAVAGVVGAAVGRNSKAIAIVGDGAMLMNSEVNTAVRFKIPTVWIVLNDGRYNMCVQGMALLGFQSIDAKIPQVDFVAFARAMGADGIRIEREADIHRALKEALVSSVPFVVDVIIDPTRPAPIGGRIKSLTLQGVK